MKEKTHAPVVLFVYNRLEHTRKTVEALLMNPESKDTKLIVYSDAPRHESDLTAVSEVREYISGISGFADVVVCKRSQNYGLAKNIIDGVTATCKEYGKVIVLEDDIVTSPRFLHFMNLALEYYKDNKKVWHVSGWNYPFPQNHDLDEVFFHQVMNCWGWGTWDDRWDKFEKNPELLINSFSKERIKKFNLDNTSDFWSQIVANSKGDINTWAVFWYATIFNNDGLCLNPCQTLVVNIGNDGSGENCNDIDYYSSSLAVTFEGRWPKDTVESVIAKRYIKNFYMSLTPNFIVRVARKIRKIIP